jgi:transcriptional regulator with XRE-family HTH domain
MSTPRAAAGRGPEDRARLAAALRDARRQARLSGTVAGHLGGMSQSKVSKIERGFLLPSPGDVDALCRAYGVPDREAAALLALAEGLREESSARVILARGVAETQRRIGQIESSASLVRSFQPLMVIGLVQSVPYMQCVFGIPDSHELTADEVAAAVAAREARQRALEDPGKSFTLIMTEGALRWHAGSPAIMADQALAISDASRRPNVRIGIIPWTTPVTQFPRGGFHLFDDDAVIVATDVATATMTAHSDVATYAEIFTSLERTASFGDEAREHLARIAADYERLSAEDS